MKSINLYSVVNCYEKNDEYDNKYKELFVIYGSYSTYELALDNWKKVISTFPFADFKYISLDDNQKYPEAIVKYTNLDGQMQTIEIVHSTICL